VLGRRSELLEHEGEIAPVQVFENGPNPALDEEVVRGRLVMYSLHTLPAAKRQRPKKRRAYHHGELRRVCIDEGLALLSREGKQAVSLREIARRAGVSPRAPYRHFEDRLALLAALAESGFSDFGAALQAALDAEEGSPVEARLAALARAYVDFAVSKPVLVELMFGDDFRDRKHRFPALDAAALTTFATLEHEVARLGGSHPADALAASAWALVHGIAELQRKGQFKLVVGDEALRARLTELALDVFIRGARGPTVR
jgi:AcrR family transcriptional regulator